jgi:putative hydrolase of the HAD superfamily
MIKAIFTDMDDTLIENQSLYEIAKAKLCDFLGGFGVTREEAIAFYEPTDKELFKTYGYSRERFPTTFEHTLKHFIPNADEDMVKTVRGFGEEVFDTVAPIKPGAAEAVRLLAQHYPVFIVTGGDKSVQTARVAALPFKKEFSGVFMIEKKDAATFLDIAQKTGTAPDEVVVIGDSLRSDIAPSSAAGFHAVWIEADNWSHEDLATIPQKNVDEAKTILEAARRILAGDIPKKPKPAKNPPLLDKRGLL